MVLAGKTGWLMVLAGLSGFSWWMVLDDLSW